MRSLLVVLALVAACHHTRKTLVPDVPQNGDANARARFAEARAQFLRDGSGLEEFKEIVDDFPRDPIVPWAELYQGMAALKARKLPDADKALQHVIELNADPGLTQRAQLFLGIAKNYEGDAAGALQLLSASGKAVENDEERTEFLAATAYASASVQPLVSLRVFDELWGRVTPTERAMIVGRLEDVVATADPAQLARGLDELDRKGPSYAIVASRLVALADESGNATEAARLRELAGPARVAIGLPRTVAASTIGPSAAGGGDPSLVGAILPLGGKANSISESAVTGLGLLAGAGDGSGVAAVEVRAATDASAAGEAVESLARSNVIAIVGPIEGDSVNIAAGRAEGLGVVLLSLSTRSEKATTGKFVFHVIPSAEARARALAKRALANNVTTFAVLAADNDYGTSVSDAFVAEVRAGGGKIVKRVTYPNKEKSFTGFAGKLAGEDWQAVFIPAPVDKLALIVPALDAIGKKPRPLGTKKVTGGGKPILLLSTAENLNDKYVIDAGRHSEGAWFAPGFYPDDQDPATKAFVDRFVVAFGHRPQSIEAYAYDAAQLAASAGAGGRTALAAALARGSVPGLTGTISFDKDHRRADPGVIYTVVEDKGSYAIHVAK